MYYYEPCMYYLLYVHVLKNIKNGSHGTVYIFKNYFATVFSVSVTINCGSQCYVSFYIDKIHVDLNDILESIWIPFIVKN